MSEFQAVCYGLPVLCILRDTAGKRNIRIRLHSVLYWKQLLLAEIRICQEKSGSRIRNIRTDMWLTGRYEQTNEKGVMNADCNRRR